MGLKEFFAKMLGKQTDAQAPQEQAPTSTEQPQGQSAPEMAAPVAENASDAPQSIEDVEKMSEPVIPETPQAPAGEENKQ